MGGVCFKSKEEDLMDPDEVVQTLEEGTKMKHDFSGEKKKTLPPVKIPGLVDKSHLDPDEEEKKAKRKAAFESEQAKKGLLKGQSTKGMTLEQVRQLEKQRLAELKAQRKRDAEERARLEEERAEAELLRQDIEAGTDVRNERFDPMPKASWAYPDPEDEELAGLGDRELSETAPLPATKQSRFAGRQGGIPTELSNFPNTPSPKRTLDSSKSWKERGRSTKNLTKGPQAPASKSPKSPETLPARRSPSGPETPPARSPLPAPDPGAQFASLGSMNSRTPKASQFASLQRGKSQGASMASMHQKRKEQIKSGQVGAPDWLNKQKLQKATSKRTM
mmetsp:Transcript_38925/g.90765  ORF Transcript_38925/g.90765 Transcript_38925/m.90765 type:complete len:334 (+) Transcript_38925:154-1155(+)